ncbi:Vomeromodulin [Myotis davidii]|uniref:Vomeromodulin n=1 Tax=Myotis davidii TaxID=225400 RepID=L5LUC2_MYODS|nr:Vomeromodulin [Myotis davidii]
MLTLWALAITLAVQAETLDLLTPPTLLGKLPVERPPLLPGWFGRSPPTPNGSSSVKILSGTSNPGCIPVAKYFMSSSKLNDSTGLFEYQLKSFQLSEEGLSTLYCASFNRKVLLPGSPLSPNPKNANISITMSNIMLREIITLSAKQSSIQMNNLNTYITRVFYASLPDNQVQAIFWVNVDKDGESFAQGQTKILVSYDCKILNGKVVSDIKIMDELRDVMSAVMKKFISTITGMWS